MIPERRAQAPFHYPHHAPQWPSKVRSHSAHAYPVSPPGAAAPMPATRGARGGVAGQCEPGEGDPSRGRQPLGDPPPPPPPPMTLPLL